MVPTNGHILPIGMVLQKPRNQDFFPWRPLKRDNYPLWIGTVVAGKTLDLPITLSAMVFHV